MLLLWKINKNVSAKDINKEIEFSLCCFWKVGNSKKGASSKTGKSALTPNTKVEFVYLAEILPQLWIKVKGVDAKWLE